MSTDIPLIRKPEDVPVCRALGQDHPEMRWYIEKRMRDLRLPPPLWQGMIP